MKHSAYIYKDRLCVFGNSIKHPEHRHYFIQIVARKSPGSDIVDIQLIASLEPHCMDDDTDSLYFTVLIHPLSFKGLKIKEYLRLSGEKKLILDVPDYFDFSNRDTAGNKAIVLEKSNNLLSLFIDAVTTFTSMDVRIRKALRYIQHSEDLSIRAADVYTRAGLSESHFHMLFKQNIGISFRQYIQYKKLERSLASVAKNKSFTHAAYEGFFADSAHLSRTVKENIGISLTKAFKNQRFVQVFM